MVRLTEITELVENPFPSSALQDVLYHGTTADFRTFRREAHGIYVTPVKEWAEMHYGTIIVPLYANVSNMKNVGWDDPVSDLFYDREYEKLAEVLLDLAEQGYNAVYFGGESESIALFGDVQIINAKTGQHM